MVNTFVFKKDFIGISVSSAASFNSTHFPFEVEIKPEFNRKLQFAGNELQTSGIQNEFNDFNLKFCGKFALKVSQAADPIWKVCLAGWLFKERSF